jgi:cytochrome c oxidase subunit 2
MVAQAWAFTPNQIVVPQGSEVTFYATSRDVIHGLLIPDTTINAMVIPGQVTKVTYRFDEAGEFLFVCHEFCGIGHAGMFGKVVVEG